MDAIFMCKVLQFRPRTSQTLEEPERQYMCPTRTNIKHRSVRLEAHAKHVESIGGLPSEKRQISKQVRWTLYFELEFTQI